MQVQLLNVLEVIQNGDPLILEYHSEQLLGGTSRLDIVDDIVELPRDLPQFLVAEMVDDLLPIWKQGQIEESAQRFDVSVEFFVLGVFDLVDFMLRDDDGVVLDPLIVVFREEALVMIELLDESFETGAIR